MTNVKKYKHLLLEQREIIEHLLNEGKNFSQMERITGIDRTTIAKEVKKNCKLYVHKNSKTVCANQLHCDKDFCDYNKDCFESKQCELLNKAPHICNSCPKKQHCRFPKVYYIAQDAQELYEERLSESRKGYDITEDEIYEIEKYIIPLIKDKKQPINHIFKNNEDVLFFSKPTFYRYVDEGVISLRNYNLPKKVVYKPRKNKENIKEKKDRLYLKGRTHQDYLNYIDKHPNVSIVEMDTVIGRQGGKCFLTLFIKKNSLLLIFLLESKTQDEVERIFIYLKEKLGIELYKKIFQVVLTDNGTEFIRPIVVERDYETNKKISKLFYCDPYAWWQKAFVENKHKHIRIPLPQGTSFDHLTKGQVHKLQNNIANIYNDKIKKTPYEATKKVFPKLLECLDINFISPNDVDLSNSYLK